MTKPMNVGEVLALYDATVRARPTAVPGLSVETLDGVTRIVGPFNLITAWDFAGQSSEAAVAREVAWARARKVGLMWRVHGHDAPADLPARLAAAGFVADPPAVLMALDLAEAEIAPGEAYIHRVESADDLEEAIRASELAFGAPAAWQRKAFTPRLGTPDFHLYTVYDDGYPVASARLEIADGGPFGGLYGGGVAPAHRGKGLYRALVAARAAAARAAGLQYLATEARETSRPILQKLGFQTLTTATTWSLDAEAFD
jgi:GNAT superfamily N-acetyltransferase